MDSGGQGTVHYIVTHKAAAHGDFLLFFLSLSFPYVISRFCQVPFFSPFWHSSSSTLIPPFSSILFYCILSSPSIFSRTFPLPSLPLFGIFRPFLFLYSLNFLRRRVVWQFCCSVRNQRRCFIVYVQSETSAAVRV